MKYQIQGHIELQVNCIERVWYVRYWTWNL